MPVPGIDDFLSYVIMLQVNFFIHKRTPRLPLTSPLQLWPRVRLMLEQGISFCKELASIMHGVGMKGLIQWLKQRLQQQITLPEDNCYPEPEFFEKIVDCYVYLKHTLFPLTTKRRIYFDRLIQPIKTFIGFVEYDFNASNKLHKYIISHEQLSQYLTLTTYEKILISNQGGLGDTLFLSWLGHLVRRQFPNSYLFLLCNYMYVEQLEDITRYLSNVIIVKPFSYKWKEFIELAAKENMFDLIIDCRYATKITATSPKYQDYAYQFHNKFLNYSDNFKDFPLGNQIFSKYGKSLVEMILITSGLDLQSFDMTINLSPDDFAIAAKLLDRPFITIGTGVDQHYAAKKNKQRTTKQWTHQYWEDLVEKITTLGILVVQLGTKHDEPLPHTLNLLGMTTFREAAALIKQALCHISVEGGLVWLAKAVGTRSVVLFGPTDRNFFGFPENRNLSAAFPCSPCWWRTENWMFACPEGYDGPCCMDALTPNLVFQEVQTLLAEKRDKHEPHFYLREVQFFGPQANENKTSRGKGKPKAGGRPADLRLPQAHNRAMAEARLTADHRMYDYVLEKVCEFASNPNPIKVLGVGAGMEALYHPLLQKRYHVTIAADDFPTWLKIEDTETWRQVHSEIDIALNSLYNLSFPSNYFDVVLILSALDNNDFKDFALKEILRVLKGRGILLITFPFMPLQAMKQQGEGFLDKEIINNIFDEDDLIKFLRKAAIQGNYSEIIIREKYMQSIGQKKKRQFDNHPWGLAMGGLVIAKE